MGVGHQRGRGTEVVVKESRSMTKKGMTAQEVLATCQRRHPHHLLGAVMVGVGSLRGSGY